MNKKKFLDKLIELKKDYEYLKIENLHLVYMGNECKDEKYINNCYNFSKEILLNMYPKKCNLQQKN